MFEKHLEIMEHSRAKQTT